MKPEDKAKLLEELSTLAIEGLKQLSSQGEKLSPESLFKIISGMPETDTLLEKAVPEDTAKTNLVSELERLKAQKSKLIRQLDDTEEKHLENESVYKRILLFFSEFIRSDSEIALNDHIKGFKDLIKKRASIDVIEKAFTSLQTVALHGSVAEDEQNEKKPRSFVSRLMKKESSQDIHDKYINQYKKAYQEIVDELGLDLDVKYLQKLLHLGKKINIARTIDEFDELRKDILLLLHEYMGAVSHEREQSAEFIKDIGKKLVEVEVDLIKTFGFPDEIFSSNTEFTDVLEEGLNELTDTLSFSDKIEELKEAVSSKLSVIKTAVKKKNETDHAMKNGMGGDIEKLRVEFEKMKNEAANARKHAFLLEHEIYTDPLTGSMNRRAYDKRLKEEFERFLRYKRTFSILLFDVDHFKNINDTYGHATGDICLKEIIKRIKPMLRESDMLARYGGEEFVVILPETDKTGAEDVAEKIRAAVEKIEFLHRDEVLKITISIGVTEVAPSDKAPSDLFDRMDMAMYEAKNNGRNRVVVK